MLLVVLLQKFLSANKPFDLRPEGRVGGETEREISPPSHAEFFFFIYYSYSRLSLPFQ
jgi:hypothetical protein